MKIAVSATAGSLDALVDPRFGRCAYFVIVEVEKNEIKKAEAIQNPAMAAMGGAGIQAAQLITSKGAEVLITGNIGPNAFSVLSGTGIKIVTGVFGISVREAVQRYLRGEIKETKPPTVLGFGPGFGPGRGMGLGRGRRFL
jgi:predicted Fe-Mo cluster-binding NifX family protein